MKKNTSLMILILSWAITAVAILAIAFIIAPESGETNSFWYRVIWTECLAVIFWFGASGWFNIQSSSRVPILPSISVLFTLISLISFILMLIDYLYRDTEGFSKYHIAMQIGLFAFGCLVFLGINLANNYAKQDIDIQKDAAKPPAELVDYLMNIEKLILLNAGQDKADILIKNIKKLREKIKYTLLDTSKTRTNPEYKVFEDDIIALVNSSEEIFSQQQVAISKEIFDGLAFSINRLIIKVESLSTKIRKV